MGGSYQLSFDSPLLLTLSNQAHPVSYPAQPLEEDVHIAEGDHGVGLPHSLCLVYHLGELYAGVVRGIHPSQDHADDVNGYDGCNQCALPFTIASAALRDAICSTFGVTIPLEAIEAQIISPAPVISITLPGGLAAGI